MPQFVRIRQSRPDNEDTQAYLRQTGRSAREIADGNAALRERHQHDITRQSQRGPGPR
jgi:hypothetical protein